MKLFILSFLLCFGFVGTLSAQHSLQLDDGAGHYSIITGQTVNPLDIFLLPPGGGMLLTSGSCWMTGGNTLTGILPSLPTEWFGSINAADVVMQTNSSEQFRLLSSGGINIPPTISTGAGMIFQNGVRFIHSAGFNNFFAGSAAGNGTVVGINNVAIGSNSATALTTGVQNTFLGSLTGDNTTTGSSNTFLGYHAGDQNTTGNENTFLGAGAGEKNTTANGNIAVGFQAQFNTTTGIHNTTVGYQSNWTNVTSSNITTVGYQAGALTT
ncbi:MAG TPA: hypothetical protein VFO76_08045, partial [Candidatus Kapabacteria bacterium]|nr:hypothetical protein [Candidatus Kapabacteria bacterium]